MKAPHSTTEKLDLGCTRLGLILSAAQRQQLCGHIELLAKWNRRLNLTAIDRLDDMVARHLLDSLAVAPFVRGGSLLDIGSGGGFPGLPLAVLDPRLQVTLLDSRGRRAEFLRAARDALELGNVAVVEKRVEDYRLGGKFDTLATRAFASLAHTLKATAALHRDGCRLLAMKGRMPKREIALLEPPWRERVSVEKLDVPFLDAERHLVLIELTKWRA